MVMSREDKLEKIDEIIREFSQGMIAFNENEISKYDEIFSEIYTDDFRHEYSRIFLQLSIIKNNNPQAIDIVAENFRHYILTKKENCPYLKSLRKLFDHVSLDVARMNYMTSQFGEQESRLREEVNVVDKEINKTKEEFNSFKQNLNAELENAKERTDQLKREYVAILGIFASIIVTFSAGMIFDSSVLNNISSVSAYRLTGITLLIGFVTFNLLYILLTFICKMLQVKGVYENPFSRSFRWVNIFFIIGALLILIAWYRGGIEYRNLKIIEAYYQLK